MTAPATTSGDPGDERHRTGAAAGPASRGGRRGRPSRRAAVSALLLRDLTVLDKSLGEFLHNTVTQPLLLVFVFTWLFPTIGQGIGGTDDAGAARFASLLMAGLIAQAMAFQGVFRVAVPLARELDVTGEIEGRVMAPTTVATMAFQKIVFGALLALFAAMVVFPVAAFLPATPVLLSVDWPVLLTLVPLACVTSAALGLTIGTLLKPASVPMLAGTLALPLAFGGAIFYTWSSLDPVPWLKYLVLVNPLVYMSEGMRAALFVGVDHMPLGAVYGALAVSAVVFTFLGTRGFRRRVVS
ncbi:MAG TPA: ABC transporter permease [Acidimicrobiales bacterium]|nr:ABC transporter permease [Acidimicrobiales bacterium]